MNSLKQMNNEGFVDYCKRIDLYYYSPITNKHHRWNKDLFNRFIKSYKVVSLENLENFKSKNYNKSGFSGFAYPRPVIRGRHKAYVSGKIKRLPPLKKVQQSVVLSH